MVSQFHPEIYLALHNIRSTHNVGAIFRTADATKVTKIYISGITPAPIDRFGRERKDIVKASLGAEKTVEWGNTEDLLMLIKKLKKEKVKIVAIEQDKRSIDYKEIRKNMKIGERVLIILGNEIKGISSEILSECDLIAEIPMHGSKESLNVSVAAGIVLYSMV